MSKRWAARSTGMRWVAGIAIVVLAVAIVWALLVPLADWLARHDVGAAEPALLQTARDAARGRLLTLGAGLIAASALLFTARTFTLSRHTFELTEQGQVTDRYTRAIEQLGSDKLDVRIGGIYALERISLDSAKDQPTVMEVLSAFIRVHSHEQWPPQRAGSPQQERLTRPDIQAAVIVVGRRYAERDIRPIDLTRADLRGADLSGANLGGVLIPLAVRHNYLRLGGAILRNADLTGANLSGARLTGARLTGANLTGAIFTDTGFTDWGLTDAGLTDTDLASADLTGADLTGARWPAAEPAPEGWMAKDDDPVLLKRTGQ